MVAGAPWKRRSATHSPQFWLAFNKARAACLKAQTDASREPDSTRRTVTWFAGLSESAVPVYVGDHILGFLETGEVMLKNPTKKHFASITRQLRAWGYKADWKQLERAYFRSCVLSPDRYRAMLRLLNIFAQHLSISVESTGGSARKGRVRQHGASAAIYREASGGAALPRAGSPRGEHQQALLLQDVQESDWDEFHRLPLESASREIEDAFAQSQLAN